MLCDSKTKYMINAMPYVGKVEINGDSLGSYYVKGLSETLWGSNRNVTIDNWFTSVPLAHQLLKEPYKLTTVGTLSANKREIPPAMLDTNILPDPPHNSTYVQEKDQKRRVVNKCHENSYR